MGPALGSGAVPLIVGTRPTASRKVAEAVGGLGRQVWRDQLVPPKWAGSQA